MQAGKGSPRPSTSAAARAVLRAMREADWEAVSGIYLEGIESGDATFETAVPDREDWDARHLPHSRFVAERDGAIDGWAALGPVSSRSAYAGVAEVSVYVSAAARGRGLGTRLLAGLIVSAEANGVWTLQAGVFPENEASLRLHGRCGFRVVGRRERIGRLHGRWRDVVLLERRSASVGVE